MLERVVKQRIKKVLKEVQYPEKLWYYMPVPNAYGGHSLDFIGVYCGMSFAIEAKAPGKNPTPRQQATIIKMQRAGVAVFVIDGDTTELNRYLIRVGEIM